MRFDRRRKEIVLLLGFVWLMGGMKLFAQANGRQAIGTLQAQGSVFVEGSPTTSGTSLFAGDTVRTGADGAANLYLPDRGSFAISANTEITFFPGARVAALRQGRIALLFRAATPASTMDIGKFVLTTQANTEAAAEVVMSADGSAHIRCIAGSVSILPLEGTQSIFLRPGDEAETLTDGSVRHVVFVPAEPAATPRAAATSHRGLILLGVGGGVAAAVAVLLALQNGQPVSPAAP